MNSLPFRSLKARRNLLVIALLLATILYAWQMVTSWAVPDDVEPRWYGAGLAVGDPSHPTGSTSTVDLYGTGIASGASGTLSFDNRGVRGKLQMWDMPILPVGQAYQVWCADTEGDIESPLIFRVFADDQGISTVMLSTDRMLYSYSRFFITIEPAGGSSMPAGQVVMRNAE